MSPTPPTRASSASAGAPTLCTRAQVRLAVATDHPAYDAGQQVLITVTLRNVSRSSCVVREDATSPDVEALDPHGRVVWSAGCGASADGATRPCPPRTITPRQLAPGKTRTWTRTWQQRASSGDSSPGPVVPRGSYTLRATQIAQATTMVEVGV